MAVVASNLLFFFFKKMFTRLEREVVRYIVAEVSVDKVADQRLQSRYALVFTFEHCLFRRLCRYVVTCCDPLINCSNDNLRRNLHRQEHLNQLFTGLVFVETTLSDVSTDFPDLKEAKDHLLRILLRNWLEEWDNTALDGIEILLHVSFQS